MKALILCGGSGTRLYPVTYNIPKVLLPVANKPVIHHILDKIVEANISDIGIVVSPDNEEPIKSALNSRGDVNLSYIVQPEARGIAHAVQVARDFLNDSPFLLFFGDNLIKESLDKYIKKFHTDSPAALLILKEVANSQRFGVAELDDSNRIIGIQEKPTAPRSNLAVVGIYLFTPQIHEAINNIKVSSRGELEITDSIQWLIDNKRLVNSHILAGWWFDVGEIQDLIQANKVFLNGLRYERIEGQIDLKTTISGNVYVEYGTKINNCQIYGPVIIGRNCNIMNSIIGPYTSIDTGNHIEGSSVKSSIILRDSIIINRRQLINSIIGNKLKPIGNKMDINTSQVFVISETSIVI